MDNVRFEGLLCDTESVKALRDKFGFLKALELLQNT